jgi:diguanylate cyclase (GGDEF)-like protein
LGALIRLWTATQVLVLRVRRTNRLLLASGFLVVLSGMWFVANLDHPRGPLLLLWLPEPLSAVILALVYRHTSRAEQLPMPTRRFWRQLSIAAILVGMGCVAQTVDALRDPFGGGQHAGSVMLVLDSGAVLVIVWALYRLPLGASTRGERLRVGLDGGTVMLATAAFFWHFQTMPLLALGAAHRAELVAQALVTVLALVAVFAVAKVVLSSYAFIDKMALRLLAFAMLIGSLSGMLQRYLVEPYLVFTQVSMPVVMFFAAWAGERQRRAGQDRGRSAARGARRRPFSVLPYAAVAAVDGLLLTVNVSADNHDGLVVAFSAVALTGVVVVRQVTAFQDNGRLLARLDHGATHDALTQLPNRVLFGERLQKALTAPGDRTVCVALIDLDDFKVVNDTLGHEIGDVLLIAVARRLATCVREQDTVARLGGDEFVVVLDGIDRAAADAAAERIIAALIRPVVADGHELRIRASIGIADGRSGDDVSQLLRRADIAMYAAKRRGGSGYLHYEPGMAGTGADDAGLGAELREAIAGDQLFLLYQPIVALDGGRLTGVEALVRWTHPVRGVLPPAEFLPFAERSGLIVPLGRWIIREACRQIAAWQAEHGEARPAVVNVNVSARELREPTFADDVAAVLAETGIAPHRLVLEVTETTVFELGTSVANLRALRHLGIRISLDDFGTGHSTLTLLQDCPVDELKLDRSFAQVDPTAEPTIATAVIHLAKALGLHVVAEGVETPQQANRLRLLGYEAAQGFYFARPMPAAQVSEAIGAPESHELVAAEPAP